MVKKINIRKEFERLANIIKEADIKIRELRKTCSHSMATKQHQSNTGNYDPSENCYWTDFHCPECEKRWREDGSR